MRLGHREAAPVAEKSHITAMPGVTGPPKCPSGGKPSTICGKQRYRRERRLRLLIVRALPGGVTGGCRIPQENAGPARGIRCIGFGGGGIRGIFGSYYPKSPTKRRVFPVYQMLPRTL